MNEYTYTILNLIFFIPVIIISSFLFHKTISKKYPFIFLSGIIGVLYFVAVDILAVRWKAWEYGNNKTLGIHILGAKIEDFVWIVLVFMLLGIAIEVILNKKFNNRNYQISKN